MRIFISIFILSSFINLAKAQDDLESLANGALSEQTTYALGTFFTSRIVTGQSVFMMPKRGLDFRVHHRFGQFNSGFNNFYGIDQSSSYLSLDYGVTDRITLGIGRATYRDIFNSFLKISILKQQTGVRNIPVSVVYFGSCAAQSTIYDNKKRNDDFAARLSFTHQLLIARMFTPALSLQVSPTFIHRNLVPIGNYNNNTFVLGLGGRYKLTNTFSVNAEGYYILNPDKPAQGKIYPPVSVGVDIQVAAHVFQIHLTNAEPMTESAFLTENSANFFNGDIRLGFNISQVFTF